MRQYKVYLKKENILKNMSAFKNAKITILAVSSALKLNIQDDFVLL